MGYIYLNKFSNYQCRIAPVSDADILSAPCSGAGLLRILVSTNISPLRGWMSFKRPQIIMEKAPLAARRDLPQGGEAKESLPVMTTPLPRQLAGHLP